MFCMFFYFNNVYIRITGEETQTSGSIMANKGRTILTQEEIARWIAYNYKEYFQKYNLSCEVAIVRMVCSALGVGQLSEEDILKFFPVHKNNPELGLVIDDIDGSPIYPDGTINWENYGAHAEVVTKVLTQIFTIYSLADRYTVETASLDDERLKQFLKEDKKCLGAIIWVAAYIDGKQPPVNSFGQVLGEHVQYVSPLLDSKERFMVYDVWPWQNQPFKLYHPLNRNLFKNKVIIIRVKDQI